MRHERASLCLQVVRARPFYVRRGENLKRRSCPSKSIHKALAGRPQDVLDIEGVVARRGAALDIIYVRRWLEELARLSDDPEVTARFERIWAEHGPRG
ncbi:MAG: hypothetical protein HY725_17125 [Candidatus Rokubacteria bacterium]|nr:hypothetical protein [Candidatus Rokubacteria bacterium]